MIMSGEVFRHYKGGLYRMLFTAHSSDNMDQTIYVYVSLNTGIIWVRPEEEWDQMVEWPDGKRRRRFEHNYEVPGDMPYTEK